MVQTRNAAFAEESAEVEVLFAEAAKFENISKRMKASLGRLESGAQVVKQAMGPVYSNTQDLQTMNSNIDNLLVAIDKILIQTEDKAKEQRIIRAGPTKSGLGDYLGSLKRVDRAVAQMTATKLRVNQQAIGDYSELLSEGSNQLQDMFRSLLSENLQPIEPLHYITKQLSFPLISAEKISQLGSIDAFISSPSAQSDFNNQGKSPAIRIYSECRGQYLSSSLSNLSLASISTSKRKNPDELYRQGTSGIGTYASGIEGIFLAEFGNIAAIFPREDWGTAFESTCRKSLAEFAKTLRELNLHIKTNLSTDCFLAYEIIEIVTGLSFRLDQKTGELKLPFADGLKPIRETAKSSLSELIEDVRRQVSAMQQLPIDGSSLPLTAEVMTRLQTMTEYPQSLASIMASLGDGNWNRGAAVNVNPSGPLDVGADGNQLLSNYIIDTIEALMVSLEGKARILIKSKSLIGVFIANNVALIDRMIRSSNLSDLLKTGPALPRIEAWRKKGTSTYLESWREPCAALMDVQYTNRGARPPSGNNGVIDSAALIKGLSSKDKDAIKEKFKTFNTSFDDLCSKHKAMAMEREVRNQLSREVHVLVEPMYARFWDRYHEIDKGKHKYVKYDKGSLAANLAALG